MLFIFLFIMKNRTQGTQQNTINTSANVSSEAG